MNFAQWIKLPALDRCYLLEVSYRLAGQDYVLRRSTHPYRTHPGDTPALTPYPDTILQLPEFERDMTEVFAGFSRTGFGDLQLFLDDDIQMLIDSANVAGMSVTLRCGDMSWPLSDFGVVLAGARVEQLDAVSSDTARLSFKDAATLFDTPVPRATISTGPNAGKPVPLTYGRCFNVSPELINEATRTYQVHDGAVQAITAVRENGLAIPYTANLAAGTFTLTNNAKGRITADVDGAVVSSIWLQSAKQIIDALIGRIGIAPSTGTLPGYALGLFIGRDQTVKSALDDLVSSVGGSWAFNRAGALVLTAFNAPLNPSANLTADDIADASLLPRRRIAPAKSIKLGYRRNWTPQADGLAGSVRETMPVQAALYEAQESLVTASNAASPDYPDAAVISHSTLIVSQADAQTEANRRALLSAVPRTVFELTAFTAPLAMELGQVVQVTYPQYFEAGAPAVITRIVDVLSDNTCKLEIYR